MAESGAQRIETAIRSSSGPALAAYLMAGYPSIEQFPDLLRSVAGFADVVEVGIPFSDPIADGPVIQQAGHEALANGVDLNLVLGLLAEMELGVPVVLMGYYNPFLAHGVESLGESLGAAGVSGVIVPDLTLEEGGEMRKALTGHGIGLIQLVAPTTSTVRMAALGEATEGFLYAVTSKGTTGGDLEVPAELLDYLEGVSKATTRPVLAGFGIRSRSQVERLSDHVDGVVVGSALVAEIRDGRDPATFLASLRD